MFGGFIVGYILFLIRWIVVIWIGYGYDVYKFGGDGFIILGGV